MILFIAKYPESSERKEGMAQRVIAVDDFFKENNRSYLSIAFFSYLNFQKEEISENCCQYRVNLFLHFYKIIKLLTEAKYIYIHSIINFLRVWLWFWVVPKQTKIILDVHGIVPEEYRFQGHLVLASCYNFVEKKLFKKVDTVICVTNAMISFYKNKYKQCFPEYIKYSIIPTHLLDDPYDLQKPTEGQVNILYSGNLQKWQNVQLILDLISYLSKDIHFYILTGEELKFRGLLKENNIELKNVTIQSVDPSQLGSYYKLAHYGIILRDDIHLNRVSCPTKMIEYLYYGMIPIVKLSEIGDFSDWNYDFIDYTKVKDDLNPMKSTKNHNIILNLIDENKAVDLKLIVFRDI